MVGSVAAMVPVIMVLLATSKPRSFPGWVIKSHAATSQDSAWCGLLMLERVGLSFEMGHIPRGQISYMY